MGVTGSTSFRHSEKKQVFSFFPILHLWIYCHIPSRSVSLLKKMFAFCLQGHLAIAVDVFICDNRQVVLLVSSE